MQDRAGEDHARISSPSPIYHPHGGTGPEWGGKGKEALLADCYRNSFALAVQNGIKTLAFPAISTGIYRFPIERATQIALAQTREALQQHPEIEKVTFVCFGEDVYESYLHAMQEG